MAAARWRHLGLAFATPALVIPLVAAPAQAVQAPPSPARPLPRALDVNPPYQGQTVCDPAARPGVLAFARLMTTHYGMGSTALIGRTCTAAASEHYDGRAWDWMLGVGNASQEAVAQSVLTWLTRPDSAGVRGAMARRFGIMYIIHDRKMWRAYAPERGWAPYYGSSPHTDHVHFSFTYDGAAGRTSWWTGVATTSYLTKLPPVRGSVVVTAPSTPKALSYGMTSEAVRQLQARLGSLPTSGWFGPMTKARVLAYQKFAGLPQTGVADVTTQNRLASKGWTGGAGTGTTVPRTYPTLSYGMTSSAVKALQSALGSLPTTGWYGPMTKARVIAYQKAAGLARTGVADNRTQQLLHTRGWANAAPVSLTTSASPAYATVSTATGFTPYKHLVLGPGSRGSAVRTLQGGLGGLAIDGVFGPVTQEKVVALQRANGWAPTGVVATEVWSVLEARVHPFVGNRTSVLRTGDEGPQVVAVQRLLGVRTTGVFDAMTREAVKRAQAGAGLASTGVVASRTWSLFDRLSA